MKYPIDSNSVSRPIDMDAIDRDRERSCLTSGPYVRGHVARECESAGIPTVSFGVQVFKSRMIPMRVPRLVITPELMGKTLGMPRDATAQH